MSSVEQLMTESAWREFYPVVEDFWPVERENEYVDYLRDMTGRGYRPFGLYADVPVSFAGVFVLPSAWYGNFVWLLDLVTRPDWRGRGHGSDLYEAVEEWARERDCDTIVLASGNDRERAHEFYERRGFEQTEYWFEKSLSADGT